MRKLVTVFATCAIAGMAVAADSNVVGYVNTPSEGEFMVFSPMFCGCGDTPATLGDIKGDFAEITDSIQVLDDELFMADTYVWLDITWSGADPVWTSDWMTDDSNVELAPGAGFILYSTVGSTVTFPSAL